MLQVTEGKKVSEGSSGAGYGTVKKLAGTIEGTTGCAMKAAAMIGLLAIGEGYESQVFSTVLALLHESFPMSSWTLGMLGSGLSMGGMAGASLVGFLANHVGRKRALCFACVCLITSSLIIGLAPGIKAVITGRIIMGIGFGVGIPTGSFYIVETSPADKRGMLGAGFGAGLSIGNALGSAAGSLLQDTWHDWRVMALIGTILPSICMYIFLRPWFPESPRWLTSRGETQRAVESLQTLHGIDRGAAMAMQKRIQAEINHSDATDSLKVLEQVLLPKPHMYRRIILAIAVPICVFLCGFIPMSIYLPVLLKEYFSRRFAVIVAGIASSTCAVIGISAASLPDIVGRRRLLILGYSCMCFGFLMLSIGMSPWGFGKGTSLRGWWTVGCYAFINFFFSLSVSHVSLFYPGEILSADLRSMGMGIGTSVARLLGFCSTLLFPVVMAYSLWLTYGIAALVNLLIALFMLAYAVETSGINLEDVANLYGGADNQRAASRSSSDLSPHEPDLEAKSESGIMYEPDAEPDA